MLRAIGHPVMWIGRFIGFLDRRLNRDGDSGARRKVAGFVALFLIVGSSAALAYAAERGLLLVPFGFIVVAILASSLIAQRSLYEHVARVADALERDGLDAGRRAVSQIVGRDPDALDEAGVARAAIESLAENFSDGVVAPVFWLAIGGLAGGAAYKAINTADSMIGHHTPRHEDFGFAAAKLDDLVNLPASRLAALLIVLASGASARERLARGLARRWETSLAERRLAGGGDGRRARAFAGRSPRLRRRHGRRRGHGRRPPRCHGTGHSRGAVALPPRRCDSDRADRWCWCSSR